MRHRTLDQLEPGRPARVESFGTPDADLASRLLDLGFDAGAEVEMLHRAPLGDPIAVRVDGTVVALRRAVARVIRLADAA